MCVGGGECIYICVCTCGYMCTCIITSMCTAAKTPAAQLAPLSLAANPPPDPSEAQEDLSLIPFIVGDVVGLMPGSLIFRSGFLTTSPLAVTHPRDAAAARCRGRLLVSPRRRVGGRRASRGVCSIILSPYCVSGAGWLGGGGCLQKKR